MHRAPIAFLAVCLFAPSARAYNEAVHRYLTGRAIASESNLQARLAAPSAADFAAFRARFWTLASHTRDPALRAEFLARFPNAASLDDWQFKEFLMLNPAARVHGFDDAPGPATQTRGALLPLASRWPDDDGRNRDRFLRNPQRQIVLDDDGEPLPFDPGTLALGGVSGASSQGHAHYGLLRGPLSDEPEVLKNDPRHFAVPPDAHSWGAQFAQLYTDLALVAHGSTIPTRDWMETAFAGAALHHLEDLANQIHTVQVGIYDFFAAAFLQSKLRDLRTLGGLFGRRASLYQLGLHIIANHHLLLEDLFAKRLLEDESGRASTPLLLGLLEGPTGLDHDDLSFSNPARVAMAEARESDAGEIVPLAYVLIDQSSREGPDCYRLIWRISAPELRDGLGYPYDGAKGDDPDRFIVASGAAGQETLAEFYALEARGAQRATTAVRLWEEAWQHESAAKDADQRAVDRILELVLPYQRDAIARRAAFQRSTPEPRIAWAWPLGALALVVALLVAGFFYLSRPPRSI